MINLGSLSTRCPLSARVRHTNFISSQILFEDRLLRRKVMDDVKTALRYRTMPTLIFL